MKAKEIIEQYGHLIEEDHPMNETATIDHFEGYIFRVWNETEKNRFKPPHLHVLKNNETVARIIITADEFEYIPWKNIPHAKLKSIIIRFLTLPDKRGIHTDNWNRAKQLWNDENVHAAIQFSTGHIKRQI